MNADRPLKNVLPYTMSKSAIDRTTRALALKWWKYGVRVECLGTGLYSHGARQKLWADPGNADGETHLWDGLANSAI